jgi:hypothetical protein
LIKQVSLLAFAALSIGRLGIAGPCSSGTLATYVSLGAAGCTIGNNTLYDFTVFSSGTTGATELQSLSVNLNPSGGNYFPTLAVSVTQTATDGNLIETFFTYDISGAGYIGTSATLSGSSETLPDGAVTGIENYCEGGSFGPDGLDGCPGANGALVTADGFQNADSAAFSKIPFIAVTDDFTIDGPASGGTFTNSFTSVPEPISISLTGVGLILAGLWGGAARRRRSITKHN